MNLELTLMELNDLYYVVSKGVESHKELVEIAKRTTPELEKYFDKELSKSVQLLDKIQTVLYNEYQVMLSVEGNNGNTSKTCLLYTSDAADE